MSLMEIMKCFHMAEMVIVDLLLRQFECVFALAVQTNKLLNHCLISNSVGLNILQYRPVLNFFSSLKTEK